MMLCASVPHPHCSPTQCNRQNPPGTWRGASSTVSCSHAFEEGVLQIQIALSEAGGGEYKLGGCTAHNGITRHNTNKAGVQANTLPTQRRTGRVNCPSHFLLIYFSVPISPLSCSSFHSHTPSRRHIASHRLLPPTPCYLFSH